MYVKLRKILLILLGLILFQNYNFAQTTGKIMGSVTDEATGEPLILANVLLEGKSIGAATDVNGDYYILNIKPGTYTLVVKMLGYSTKKIEKVVVSVNRTTNINVQLSETIITGGEVVVIADKVSLKKDQTGSVKNVSSEQIEMLPVEGLDQVISMQAGVVGGHFRGGRLNEVSYLVDGMQVNEAFGGTDKTVGIEKEAAQDLEVITGTFNAEYGRAMSGIVNVVTKEGGNKFRASISSSISNYYTANTDVFIGLKASEVTRNQDYKITFEGPIIKDKITFFTNFRYQDSQGHINGIRRFNVNDYSNANNEQDFGISTPWDFKSKGKTYYSEHTGDNEHVPMNTNLSYSGLAKLTFRFSSNFKTSIMGTWNYGEAPGTGHTYKYKPDGRAIFHNDSKMGLIQFNHLISNSAFHDLKISYVTNNQHTYLYKDPFDSRFVHTSYNSSLGGFISGGQDRTNYQRKQSNLNIKYDLVWQLNKQHSLKTGLVYTGYTVENLPLYTQNKYRGTPFADMHWYDKEKQTVKFYSYNAELLPEDAIAMDRYKKEPYEFSGYIQDKMEFDEMVINLGLRYDYFNSNTVYPTQKRNPANQLKFDKNPERMSTYPEAPAQWQLSPRFGLSYTLGKAAVLHFSYGHFFQMPPLYTLYSNYRFKVPTGNFGTVMGNPQIKAEKTVTYEMGIWQEIIPNMGLELSVYYKDIYDLRSAIVVTTYNQIKYGLYSNKDYGNAKGFELKFDYLIGKFAIYFNYTLQYTRGNADNPTTTYSRLGQSLDPVPYLVPLSWDQRHTANLSVGYREKNYSVTLTGYFNSGKPYTFRPVSISPLAKQTLYPNNSERPANYSLDLTGNYDFDLGQIGKLRLFLSIYNLLDTKNELSVNSSTGRAYTGIVYPVDLETFRSNYNDIYDAIHNPYMFSSPREIKFGVGIIF